jgi:type I restriction enzyme S subunit
VEINPESLGTGTPDSYEFQYIDISSVEKGVVDWNEVETHTYETAPSRAKRIVRRGDVLLSTVRPTLQGHTYADWSRSGEFVCSTGFAVLRAEPEVEPSYLRHLVFSDIVDRQLRERITGSNYPAVRSSDVEELKIPLPRICEQRRIADVLDTVDAAIRETDAVVEKQEQVKTGLLQDLLTRGLDAEGRLRDPEREPEAFREAEMGQVPKNWCVRRLSDVAEVGSGIAINRSRTKSNAVELPYLRVANVQDGYLDLSEIKTLEIEASKVDRYLLEPGDVLMTEGGDYDKLGRGTVWEGQVQPCVHQNHIFRVRTSDDKLRPRFLSVITGSDYGKRYFLRNSKQTTNLATINKSQLRDFPVPLPSPLEQDRIIERIATQEEQIDSNTRYKRKLQSLKAGLMQDLLTGRVRVPEAEDRVDEVIA